MTRDEKIIHDACEEIDAAIFSGDFFDDQKHRDEFLVYLGRWNRNVKVDEMVEELV